MSFTQAGRDAIEEACREAERRTSGEIVPYVVKACDAYATPAWQGALFGALGASAVTGLVHWLAGLWGGAWLLWILAPPVLGGVLGFLVVGRSETLTRCFLPDEILELRARRRAMVAFLEEEIFLTRERTGILLFLGLFEHRAIVLGDAGIHAKVEQSEWDGIVEQLVEAIRAGRAAEGLADAIRACGELLERHGVARRKDDVNELPNRLQLRES